MSLTLPIIDISPFLLPNSSPSLKLSTAKSIHSACLEFGFFYLTGLDSIITSIELNQSIEIVREFFTRPIEEKNELKIKEGDGARGYQMIQTNVTEGRADFHEALDLYCPLPPSLEDSTKLLHGPNIWPSNPPNFKPNLESYIEKMKLIGMSLLEATAVGLGLDTTEGGGEEWKNLKRILELPESSFWVMRAIGYPPLPEGAEGISCGSHCDYGLWTLLNSDETRGALQVFHKNENGQSIERGLKGDWILAHPLPNCIVVNIGDMWETLTNGLYKATLHRVIHKGENYRVSLPFFYEPSLNAIINPIQSIIESQLKNQTKESLIIKESINYGDYLRGKVSGNFNYSSVAV